MTSFMEARGKVTDEEGTPRAAGALGLAERAAHSPAQPLSRAHLERTDELGTVPRTRPFMGRSSGALTRHRNESGRSREGLEVPKRVAKCYKDAIVKLLPIVSEFATTEEAEACDR